MPARVPQPGTDGGKARSHDPLLVHVLLADREGAARSALAALLQGLPGIVLVGAEATVATVQPPPPTLEAGAPAG